MNLAIFWYDLILSVVWLVNFKSPIWPYQLWALFNVR